MHSINFGIIGFGNIGKRHLERIEENENSNLIAICDVNESKLQIDNQGILKYTNYFDLLNNPDIDVVTIATPNSLHSSMTIDALEAKKHVLCEKPMALSVKDCNKMILSAQKNNKLLFIVKQNRFNPPVKKVKELLTGETLGKPLFIVVNCFWNRNKNYYKNSDWKGKADLDGGTLYTQFSHFVDIVYYLFGDFENVSAIGKNFTHNDLIEFEDTGVINFQMDSGVIGALNYTTCSYEKNLEGSFTIFCEKGTIKIGGQYLNTIDYFSIEGVNEIKLEKGNTSNDYGYYQGSMSNHDKVIDNVVKTLNNKETIATSAFEGMKIIQFIEAAYESMKTHKTIKIQ